MACQDDSVPDGIGDDPPLNDVAGSRQGGTRVIIDKWGSQHFFFASLLLYITWDCTMLFKSPDYTRIN